MLSKAARKELKRIADAGPDGLRGADANLRSAPALVRRGLARVELWLGRAPYYCITDAGRAALAENST